MPDSKLFNGVVFDKDAKVHRTHRRTICEACIEGFPQLHIRSGAQCAGLIHCEKRYDLEAGYEQTYETQRCDGCDFEEEVR